MKKLLPLVAGCMLVLFASCKKDKDQAPSRFVTADVDGKAVNFNTNNLARTGGKLYIYGASDFSQDATAIAINVSLRNEVVGMGTYTGSADDSRYVGISFVQGPFAGDQSNQYNSDFADAGVSVKITSLTKDNVQGTFRGSVYLNSKSRSITNGKFNLDLTN